MSLIKSAAYEKTDELDASAVAAGADFVIASQSGNDKKMTLTKVATFISSGITNLTVTLLSATNVNIGNDLTMADAGNIILNTTTGTQIGTASAQKLGFYGVTPVDKGAVLTTVTSAATYTLSGAADAAFSVVTSGVNFSLQTAAEFQGLLNTVVNTKTRMDEMESRIQDTGLVN